MRDEQLWDSLSEAAVTLNRICGRGRMDDLWTLFVKSKKYQKSCSETSDLNSVRPTNCNAVIHTGGQEGHILLSGKEQGANATKGIKMLLCEKVTEECVK